MQVQKLSKPSLIVCAKQNVELLSSYMQKPLPDLKPNQLEIVHDQKVVLFDNKLSRNLGIMRTDQLEKQLSHMGDGKELLIIVPNKSLLVPAALSVARHFPTFSRKTERRSEAIKYDIAVVEHSKSELLSESKEKEAINRYVESTQLAAELVDTPPNELYTTAYAERVKKLVKDLPVQVTEIMGEDLKNKGYGGLWNVGKAAVYPPVLLVLSYRGDSSSESSISLVGKGIVYDAGGLSIKGTANMCSMKSDMGGSAACVGAFLNLVKSKVKKNVHAVLCLAENAVDAHSYKNDDIFTLFSGKTVEINNTDAEGRLVLADGVAHASKVLKSDLIVDIATLTGAQMVATGMNHAGLLSNDEKLEHHFVSSAKSVCELVHPMLYCPELLMSEFDSKVADMKNSVKDRMNASSSCAGHFVESNIVGETKWVHLDIAGPSFKADRGTGFGSALLAKAVLDLQ